MSDPYLGEIRAFAGNYAPANWQFCDGSLLRIDENDTLFTLVGTTYGGDGQSNFAVPDLRGRLPVGQGQGSGLTARTLGQSAGLESITVLLPQMPQHAHGLIAQNIPAISELPTGAFFAQPGDGALHYLDPNGVVATDVLLAPDTVQNAGENHSHENRMPGLTASYIISLSGIYPQHN